MRIAVISTMLGQPWTGSEELWAAMTRCALREKHEVLMSLWRWPELPPQVAALRESGAQLHLRRRPGALPTLNGVLDRLAGKRVSLPRPRVLAPLSAYHRVFAFRPDVICLSQGWVYEFRDRPELQARLIESGIPFVVVCQANIEDTVSDEMRRDGQKFFPQAARVAFVADGNLRAARRQMATPLPQGIVVRNPVNMSDVSCVEWPRDNGTWNMACVGRLDCGHKGQDILLEALSAPSWKNRDWRLRLFGAGPEKAYLESLIEHFGLRGRVEFGGHVSDVRQIWARHHLLVMPSRVEGTPLALVEAMLCGRAAVVTDIAGHPEWIEEGKTGFLAAGRTVHSVGAALERAWENRARWRPMGEAAHAAAALRYDETPGKTLLDILCEAAKRPTMSDER